MKLFELCGRSANISELFQAADVVAWTKTAKALRELLAEMLLEEIQSGNLPQLFVKYDFATPTFKKVVWQRMKVLILRKGGNLKDLRKVERFIFEKEVLVMGTFFKKEDIICNYSWDSESQEWYSPITTLPNGKVVRFYDYKVHNAGKKAFFVEGWNNGEYKMMWVKR